ncbi:receptor-like protein EIX2 [Telopea speciosissima]|uniref:receptor-like protein EIX2 n=1 Tax=Telopea speciosissima TaxID=54955 RepID=UPI001CC76E27|nr:receptor-like protein EIX2 [Telopea speciosissima]
MDCSSSSINIQLRRLLLFIFLLSRFSSCNPIINGDPIPNERCKEVERKALLKFKEGINQDHAGRLSSWTTGEEEDCCRWRGVGCSNRTGHVVHLNLRNPIQLPQYDDDDEVMEAFMRSCLSGEINPSLLNLKDLKYMDLSSNNFGFIHIPNFLGSFQKLRYLNLSHSFFAGTVPPQLGNLSTLHHLDLSSLENDFYSFSESENPYGLLRVDNLDWISRLSSLESLNMGVVNLSNTADHWLQAFNKLSLLRELKLPSCELGRLPSSQPLPSSIANFTSLSVLDLSWNNFNNSFLPHLLLNMSNLEDLDLSGNQLILNFSYSNIVSSIHSGGGGDASYSRTAGSVLQVGSLWKLRRLDLSYNNGGGGDVGALVDGLSGFSNKSLEILVLSYTELSGHLPISIGRFLSLKQLDLSENQISGHIPDESFGQLSNLVSLSLSDNQMSGPIPERFGQLSNLISLDLSGNQISGPIPESFGQLSNLVSLYLSYNQISGPIPESFGQLSNLVSLYLSYNQISGPIPHESVGQLSELVSLDISGNYWEGSISEHIFTKLTNLKELLISSFSRTNKLVFYVRQEWVPPFKLHSLELFDFQMADPNKFPQWLRTQNLLTSLTLRNVSISDTIPEWLWKSFSLVHLDLSRNRLRGTVPSVRKEVSVDLSSNCLEGPLPLWSANLDSLSLRDNLFSGPISSNFGQTMPILSQLDLSNNHLSGGLSSINWKGLQRLEILDLSNNNLSGKIPSSIGFHLPSLERLIFSNNNFYGELPSSLRYCTSLVSLDLSNNNFSGILPTWIGENLLHLAMLNLQANSFTGKIPQQLCRLKYLGILVLAQNQFSGFIPTCFGNLSGFIDGERYGYQ